MTILEETMIQRLIDLEQRIETAARALDQIERAAAEHADFWRGQIRPWLQIPDGEMEVRG